LGRIEGLRYGRLVGNIHSDSKCFATTTGDVLGYCTEAVGPTSGQYNPRTGASQGSGEALAEASGGASHQSYAASERK
jgi:hypothetical protein